MTNTNESFPSTTGDGAEHTPISKTIEEMDAESRASILAKWETKEYPLPPSADLDEPRTSVYADLGGLNTLSNADSIPRDEVNQKPETSNKRPGYRTKDQRSARAHERQARKDRYGR